jgi:transposase
MTESTLFIGLDVHASSISVALAEGRKPAHFLGKYPNDFTRLLKALDRLADRDLLYVAYEAGPTGYGLQRALTAAGIRCDVIAPSKMPKAAGDKVKTDRRDALRLAHLLRCGDLTKIHVPDEACEAMRDLIRSREDAKRAQLRARHQLSKFLLRHGRHWEKTNWTHQHFEWIGRQSFDHPAQERVLQECLQAVYECTSRIQRYDSLLAELAPTTDQADLITALQAFRGIKLLTAATIAFELGDLKRFPSAKKLMSYLGATPSEDSSGDRVRRGKITKAGNGGLRRLLIEAAWAYRHKPRVSYHLKKRSEGVAPNVQEIAWKAQLRLNKRYKKMTGKGKNAQKTLVAMARELAGFIWAVGQEKVLVV